MESISKRLKFEIDSEHEIWPTRPDSAQAKLLARKETASTFAKIKVFTFSKFQPLWSSCLTVSCSKFDLCEVGDDDFFLKSVANQRIFFFWLKLKKTKRARASLCISNSSNFKDAGKKNRKDSWRQKKVHLVRLTKAIKMSCLIQLSFSDCDF